MDRLGTDEGDERQESHRAGVRTPDHMLTQLRASRADDSHDRQASENHQIASRQRPRREGYLAFERTHQLPRVTVGRDRRYHILSR